MLNPNNRNNFLPASRYYGDRFPRTMDEAFGPGAKLTTDDEKDMREFAVLALGVVMGVGLVLWALAVQ